MHTNGPSEELANLVPSHNAAIPTPENKLATERIFDEIARRSKMNKPSDPIHLLQTTSRDNNARGVKALSDDSNPPHKVHGKRSFIYIDTGNPADRTLCYDVANDRIGMMTVVEMRRIINRRHRERYVTKLPAEDEEFLLKETNGDSKLFLTKLKELFEAQTPKSPESDNLSYSSPETKSDETDEPTFKAGGYVEQVIGRLFQKKYREYFGGVTSSAGREGQKVAFANYSIYRLLFEGGKASSNEIEVVIQTYLVAIPVVAKLGNGNTGSTAANTTTLERVRDVAAETVDEGRFSERIRENMGGEAKQYKASFEAVDRVFGMFRENMTIPEQQKWVSNYIFGAGRPKLEALGQSGKDVILLITNGTTSSNGEGAINLGNVSNVVYKKIRDDNQGGAPGSNEFSTRFALKHLKYGITNTSSRDSKESMAENMKKLKEVAYDFPIIVYGPLKRIAGAPDIKSAILSFEKNVASVILDISKRKVSIVPNKTLINLIPFVYNTVSGKVSVHMYNDPVEASKVFVTFQKEVEHFANLFEKTVSQNSEGGKYNTPGKQGAMESNMETFGNSLIQFNDTIKAYLPGFINGLVHTVRTPEVRGQILEQAKKMWSMFANNSTTTFESHMEDGRIGEAFAEFMLTKSFEHSLRNTNVNKDTLGGDESALDAGQVEDFESTQRDEGVREDVYDKIAVRTNLGAYYFYATEGPLADPNVAKIIEEYFDSFSTTRGDASVNFRTGLTEFICSTLHDYTIKFLLTIDGKQNIADPKSKLANGQQPVAVSEPGAVWNVVARFMNVVGNSKFVSVQNPTAANCRELAGAFAQLPPSDVIRVQNIIKNLGGEPRKQNIDALTRATVGSRNAFNKMGNASASWKNQYDVTPVGAEQRKAEEEDAKDNPEYAEAPKSGRRIKRKKLPNVSDISRAVIAGDKNDKK